MENPIKMDDLGVNVFFGNIQLGLPNRCPKMHIQDTELAVILPIPRSAPDMMCCVVSGKPAWWFLMAMFWVKIFTAH